MKEAIITDLEGYYQDTTLVADDVTGVFPIFEPVKQEEELEPMEAPEEPTELETVHVGYTVSVPVPEGLYKPRYDLEAWQAALEQYELDMKAWKQEQQPQGEEDEAEPLSPPEPVDLAQFWAEGLTPEEIDEIRNRPQEPSIPERVEKVENDTAQTMLGLVEVYEANEATDEENKQSMLAMVELYGIIEAQGETIQAQAEELAAIRTELAALKGGEG